MNKLGPIIIIEDDTSDQRIMVEIFKKLDYSNETVFFSEGTKALEYLNSTDKIPFIILSDINMPKVNGFERRKKIQENKELALKCVPFLFFSNGADKKSVADAYAMSVQGFFRKPLSIDELENTIKKIMEYWRECIAPSDYGT